MIRRLLTGCLLLVFLSYDHQKKHIRDCNITISFKLDSTCEVYDYNDRKNEQELLKGRFAPTDSTLNLFYSDRRKQKFSFKKNTSEKKAYHIENLSGYFFIKAGC